MVMSYMQWDMGESIDLSVYDWDEGENWINLCKETNALYY